MNLSLGAITERLSEELARTGSRASVEFALEARELAVLSGSAHVYDDPYLIIQLTDGNQGYVFAHPDEITTQATATVVGRPICDVELSALPRWLSVALLDAVTPICRVLPTPTRRLTLTGTARQKSLARANFIVDLLPVQHVENVAVIGGIEDIVERIAETASSLRIADFHLAGTKLCGIEVETDFISLLEWCDIALVTGNTLKTDTLSSACAMIEKRNTYAVSYTMTGHNIFPAFLDDLPFRWITSESFPFYWFAGSDSIINAFKGKP